MNPADLPPKKFQKNLFSQKSLLEKIEYYLPENLLLAILVWLCQEITKHGGSPNHLDPENYHKDGHSLLRLKNSHHNKWMHDVIRHALIKLPQTKGDPKVKSTPTTKSAAAMRKILKEWGTKYKAFHCLDKPEHSYPGIEKLELLREMTLSLSLNNCHPKATRMSEVRYYLTGDGQAQFSMTIKYARDGSSWNYGSRDDGWYLRLHKKEEEANFTDGLLSLTGLRLIPIRNIQFYPKTSRFRIKTEKKSTSDIREIREFKIS